ncbi:MAG: histidine kinase [Polyangiaceae bacterium]
MPLSPDDSTAEAAVVDALALRRRRVLGIAVVILVSLLQVVVQYLAGHERARLLSHLVLIAFGMPPLMGTLSVGYAWATRRRMGVLETLLGGIVVAGVLGAVIGVLNGVLARYVPALVIQRTQGQSLTRAMLFGFTYGELNYGLWALAFVFPFAIEDARVRSLEAETLRLEAEKLRTAAELARLRGHLEPHFLLNTLNAIAGLVTDDPREARRLLVCLGDLLRDALRDEDEMQTLDDQIEWLRRYAAILEARHPTGLVFRWEIARETKSFLLPRLLLQPLVENAVKHGALKRRGGGEVVVATSVGGDGKIVCAVSDNGPGMPSHATRSGAFGLHAVRRRLELKYMEQASLRIESSSVGTRSIVELPIPALAKATL